MKSEMDIEEGFRSFALQFLDPHHFWRHPQELQFTGFDLTECLIGIFVECDEELLFYFRLEEVGRFPLCVVYE
jgi:hypothetical protein